MKSLKFNISLFIIVLFVTLISLYFLTLEMDSCMVYAEQADQYIQSGQSDHHRSQRHHDRDNGFPITSDGYLALICIVLTIFVVYKANEGFGF